MPKHSIAYLRIMTKRRSRKIRNRILLFLITAGLIAIIAAWFGFDEVQAQGSAAAMEVETETQPIENVKLTAGVATVLSGIELTSVTIPEPVTETTSHTFSTEEAYLLAKIAMAEAEGEDTEGKALVIVTVLNRVHSGKFPDTISEVIYEENAFTPIRNGRFDKVEPNEDCYAALSMVENGWDESQGALYFERTTTQSTWHSRNLKKLFEHGKHTFYTEEADA